MKGKFYGVGVGPGDPELLTIKAIQTIKNCEVLAIPVSDRAFDEPVYEAVGERPDLAVYLERCVAYQIVLPMIPEVNQKPKLYLPMPMIKEPEQLRQIHDRGAAAVGQCLQQGMAVAFLTLGDPTVYSTCLYIHKRIKKMGFETGLIPGIPSFCAAAARMDIGLVENREELHVLPSSYEIESGLALKGTKVLMKAGQKMSDVKARIRERQLAAKMVENCGMRREKIYHQAEDIPDQASYYSLIVVKEER